MDDHILATCGNEGSAYEWDVQKALRVNEYIIKSNPWTGIAMTANGKSAYAVGETFLQYFHLLYNKFI